MSQLMLFGNLTIEDHIDAIVNSVELLDLHDKVAMLNRIRKKLHEVSPFKNEPVDFVEWVHADAVKANDYNPNKVAPPEMELLEISIMNDGYTQPIVTWPQDDHVEVIDGFHRSRVGKESQLVADRIKGFLPTVAIRKEQTGKSDRIASTIRHNRARGKHQIDAMSEIVIELKNRNWTNSRVARELGMDEDEVLRLCQISGLGQMFSDADFSSSWEADDAIDSDYEELTDDIDEEVRTANTNDPNRTFHTFEKWECHKAGFYASTFPGKSKQQCEVAFAEFLANDSKFRESLECVITKWVHSCQHYLTNKAMNRIAWLGQAAMCFATGIPSVFCSGFGLLSEEQKDTANNTALEYLNRWLVQNGMQELTMDEAMSIGRQVEIY
jgi:hypothetical protein